MSTVVKPKPEVDQYVVWSDITDGPMHVGTRSETLAYLCKYENHGPAAAPHERLQRADNTGTSALWPSPKHPHLGWGFEECAIYDQRGMIPCEDMGTLAQRITEGKDVSDLLIPFEGDD